MGRVPIRNPANALTVLRLLLIPLFAALVVSADMTDAPLRIAASLVFAVASLTDFADGWIARTWGLVTAFGKVADPIADKALTGTALVLLSIYDRLPWWVTIVILARELAVTLLRLRMLRYGVIAASRGGKVKTSLQILAIMWYLWPFSGYLGFIGPWLMSLALVATIVTGVDYAWRALALRRNTPN